MASRAGSLVCVVTADIVGSSRYGTHDRRKLDKILRSAFKEVQRRFPTAVHTTLAFRITAGDEFQFVLTKIPSAFRILIYLRALAASSGLSPSIALRAGVGVGDIRTAKRDDPYEEDGVAFAHARRALEDMIQVRGQLRWTRLFTGKPDIDNPAETLLLLTDWMQKGWTVPQWQAIRWSLLGLKREEIAGKLGIAHQNVTKRLSAAGWPYFEPAVEYFEGLLAQNVAP